MIGKTLRLIREGKGFTLRSISQDIVSPSQLSKIENNTQVPNVDTFFHLLYRMNVTFDEFCLLTDDEYISTRTTLSSQIGEVLRKRNVPSMKRLIASLEAFHEKYHDPYFLHAKRILKAHIWIITENNFVKAQEEVAEIADYLFSIDDWFYYELALLNNTLFFFKINIAIELGDNALKQIEAQYNMFKDNEASRKLLNNLAVHTLKDERYYMNSYRYSSTAIGLPQSTQHIYSTIFAKITNQVACFKLQNGEYNPECLANLIQLFSLINMDDIHNECQVFVKEHGIHL